MLRKCYIEKRDATAIIRGAAGNCYASATYAHGTGANPSAKDKPKADAEKGGANRPNLSADCPNRITANPNPSPRLRQTVATVATA